MINEISTNFEAQREHAITLWRQQRELELILYKQYLVNMNLYAQECSLEKFLSLREYHARTHPTNPSLSSAMGLWDKAFDDTLYSNDPQRAKKAFSNRQIGGVMTDIVLFSAFLSGIVGPTAGLVLLASISGIGLLIGSVAYLTKATYDYFNTPKSERTPLQKFNMLSSIPSALLVFFFVNAAISAVAAPGLILPMVLIGGAWFGYKVWQANKGASIKWSEYRGTETKLASIKNELAQLRCNNPAIDADIEKDTMAARLKQIEQDPYYISQQLEKRDLETKLARLDETPMNRREELPSHSAGVLASYSMFSQNREAEYGAASYIAVPPRK